MTGARRIYSAGNKSDRGRVFSNVTMTASALNVVSRVTKPGKSPMDPAGKLALFEQIIVPHLNAAYNLARWLTRNGPDAEDLVQEAYLRAFRSFDTFQGSDDGRAWLLAIVRNTCLTFLKKKGGQPTIEFDEQTHIEADESPNAESILVDQADLSCLQDCIEALPVEFREVVILRELEELSYKEIADVARVPIGTVMSRLARARTRLQQCMNGKKETP